MTKIKTSALEEAADEIERLRAEIAAEAESAIHSLKAENEQLREALNKIIKHSELLRKSSFAIQGDPEREMFSAGFKVGWAEAAEICSDLKTALSAHNQGRRRMTN